MRGSFPHLHQSPPTKNLLQLKSLLHPQSPLLHAAQLHLLDPLPLPETTDTCIREHNVTLMIKRFFLNFFFVEISYILMHGIPTYNANHNFFTEQSVVFIVLRAFCSDHSTSSSFKVQSFKCHLVSFDQLINGVIMCST